jgi:hypothetical protein
MTMIAAVGMIMAAITMVIMEVTGTAVKPCFIQQGGQEPALLYRFLPLRSVDRPRRPTTRKA